MSKAKITKKDGYECAPDGHTIVTFEYGATVEGKVADWACADRATSRVMDKKRKTKNMGAAPENK